MEDVADRAERLGLDRVDQRAHPRVERRRRAATLSGAPCPRSAVCSAARPSVGLTISPANSASRARGEARRLGERRGSRRSAPRSDGSSRNRSGCRASSIASRASRSGSAANSSVERSARLQRLDRRPGVVMRVSLRGLSRAPARAKPSARRLTAPARPSESGAHGQRRRDRAGRARRAAAPEPKQPESWWETLRFLLILFVVALCSCAASRRAVQHPLGLDAAAADDRRLSVRRQMALRLFALLAAVRRCSVRRPHPRRRARARRRRRLPLPGQRRGLCQARDRPARRHDRSARRRGDPQRQAGAAPAHRRFRDADQPQQPVPALSTARSRERRASTGEPRLPSIRASARRCRAGELRRARPGRAAGGDDIGPITRARRAISS